MTAQNEITAIQEKAAEERLAWNAPRLRQLDAKEAELAPVAGVDGGVLS